MSSGTVSLFASMAIAIAGAFAAAFALKHPDHVRAIVATIASSSHSPAKDVAADAGAIGSPADVESSSETGDVTLRAGDYGHFETEAEINGRPVDVMVDTGATLVALTYEDAERSGIFLKASDFTHQVSTANGIALIAPITISSISIGGITVRNIQGAVSEPGKLQRTLLGMSFLGRLSRVDMRAKTLVLHE